MNTTQQYTIKDSGLPQTWHEKNVQHEARQAIAAHKAQQTGEGNAPRENYKRDIHPKMLEALNRLELELIHYRNTGVGYQHLCNAMDDVHAFDNGGQLV